MVNNFLYNAWQDAQNADAATATNMLNLIYVQDFFGILTKKDPATFKSLYTTVDDLLLSVSKREYPLLENAQDRLQKIIDFATAPTLNILGSLHSKNIREHPIVPFNQIRETDSTCTIYLSKKPGRSAKQKIALNKKAMCVIHRISFDTVENRLFKEFLTRLYKILSQKIAFQKSTTFNVSQKTKRLMRSISQWQSTTDAQSIGVYKSASLNNALLYDKNYHKIYKAYLLLKNLENDSNNDIKKIRQLTIVVFFWRLIARLNQSPIVKFYQDVLFCESAPITLDDELRPIELKGHIWHNNKFEEFRVGYKENAVTLETSDNECNIEFPAGYTFCDVLNEVDRVIKDMFPCVENTIQNTGAGNTISKELSGVVACNLHSIMARFYTGDSFIKQKAKLLYQMDIKTGISYSCRNSKMLLASGVKTFSIRNIFDSGNFNSTNSDLSFIESACNDFAKTISQNVCTTAEPVFIVPDKMDVFSPRVKIFKRVMKSFFPNSKFVPRSICAIFSNDARRKSFKDNDRFCVVDSFRGKKIAIQFSVTKHKESGTLIFNRHEITFLEKTKVPNQKVITINNVKDANTLCRGAYLFALEQKVTPNISLWRDYIPSLFMRISNGNDFALVDEKNNVPVNSLEVTEIPIKNHFIFPAKKPFYEFPLIIAGKDTPYFAYLKNDAFPLHENVECSLRLTYDANSDQPYTLIFTPVKKDAPFSEVAVIWDDKSHKDTLHLNAPNFMAKKSWADMRCVKTRENHGHTNSDLTGDWLIIKYRDIFNFYRLPPDLRFCERNPYSNNDRDPYIRELTDKYKFYNFTKTLRYPVLTVFSDARSITDDDCPDDFRRETEFVKDRVLEYLMDGILGDYFKDEFYLFLCYMHKDCPKDFRNSFITQAKKSDDLFRRYCQNLGYLIGDSSQDWQMDLLGYLLNKLYNSKISHYAAIALSIALWRSERVVYTFDIDDVRRIIDAIKNIIYKIEPKLPFFSRVLSSLFEILLALMRLRKTFDGKDSPDTLCEALSPYYNKNLKAILEKLKSFSKIDFKTFLTFDIGNVQLDCASELLYVTRSYIAGSIDDNSIKVLGVDYNKL